jgi:hypothetical protein
VTSSRCAWMPSDRLNGDMSVATTEWPRLASTCAVAIPMPRADPVIKILSAFDIRKSTFSHVAPPLSGAVSRLRSDDPGLACKLQIVGYVRRARPTQASASKLSR